MICFGIDISGLALEFFCENKITLSNFSDANHLIRKVSGLKSFFNSQIEATELLEKITTESSLVSEPHRREYGDYQTNVDLASEISKYAVSKYHDIEFVLEPTCGKGNFILAAIKHFSLLKKVVGVEIYLPYVWETKINILNYYLESISISKPEIDIIHCNAFEFSYDELANSTKNLKTLVIGNPPWVTNSELGSISSKNLPQKSNIKKHVGLDAITGKGNFDIGEYISLGLLQSFQYHDGVFAFLIKNSVVKNIIHDQKRNAFRISRLEMLNINSKKEFNVSVNASLFLAYLNTKTELTCREEDFYSKREITTFGWYRNKFVYSVDDYDQTSVIDGKSSFVWRSGVKHDCSKIMELEQVKDHYKNGLSEEIYLEKDLIYGLLKSSDLKGDQIDQPRKFTIITQNKIGQKTNYIKTTFPFTYNYLNSHIESFNKRKSSIYIDKPDFSIFGIGDYSFSKYKVAISGLYKSTYFTLVMPNASKPIMLDDTCYFIGFNHYKMAQIAHFLLNSDWVQKFLKSIIFSDAKRSINKDTLMRIDLKKVYEIIDFKMAKQNLHNLEIQEWEDFRDLLETNVNAQVTLF